MVMKCSQERQAQRRRSFTAVVQKFHRVGTVVPAQWYKIGTSVIAPHGFSRKKRQFAIVPAHLTRSDFVVSQKCPIFACFYLRRSGPYNNCGLSSL